MVKSSLKPSCRVKQISSQASSPVSGRNFRQVKSRSSQVSQLFWSSQQVKSSSQAACPPYTPPEGEARDGAIGGTGVGTGGEPGGGTGVGTGEGTGVELEVNQEVEQKWKHRLKQ